MTHPQYPIPQDEEGRKRYESAKRHAALAKEQGKSLDEIDWPEGTKEIQRYWSLIFTKKYSSINTINIKMFNPIFFHNQIT